MSGVRSIVCYAVFGVTYLIFFVLFIASRKRYEDCLEPLSKDDFPFKGAMPVGIFCAEHFRITKLTPKFLMEAVTSYNRRYLSAVNELYTKNYTEFYSLMYNGKKWLFGFLGIMAASALSSILCLQNDAETGTMMLGIGVFVSGCLVAMVDKTLFDKVDRKQLMIQYDFPDFANKLILLVNAGMVVSNAWEKIALESEKDTPLYRELNISLKEIMSGASPREAYENMATRCKIREIKQFIFVITSNLELGGDMLPELKKQASDCWLMRKAAAQRLGEQASTKLLLPIGVMLIGVMIIVITPAILLITQGM